MTKKVKTASPFYSTSMIYAVFEMSKRGTTISEIVRFVNSVGGDAVRIMRRLRRCETGRYRWRVIEDDGKFKIVYPVE